jgi:hypothetical protein
MADVATIADVINMLRKLGCKPPDSWAGMKASEVAGLWGAILADMPDDDLRRAAVLWAQGPKCQYFPMPGDLLSLVGQAQKPVTENDRKAAGDAVWSQIQRAYHAAGGMYGREAFAKVPLSDVARDALESVGGWLALRAAMCAEDDRFSLGELERKIARQVAVRPDSSTPAGIAALIEASQPQRPPLRVIEGGRS